ncbi:putative reverse transcriptase domain-containing protein [Tanacetum coccineum]
MASSKANQKRTKKACNALKHLGISAKAIRLALKGLLKAYENNWMYIEEENYKVLIDAIFEPEEPMIDVQVFRRHYKRGDLTTGGNQTLNDRDTIMSLDEASSGVTYTSISSEYKEPTDVGSLEVVAPLSPDYVPGPEYPEYLALSDEEEEASKEDEDKDEEEEEEHLAPADSTAVASPVVEPVPSVEETEPFETDKSATTPPPPPAYRTTARIYIRAQTPIPFPSEAEVDRLLAIPTPPPSPLTPLSSLLPHIPSLPLPVSSSPFPVPSPPTASHTYTKAPLGYRAAGIRLKTASPPPLPLSSALPLPPPILNVQRKRAPNK